MTNKDKEKIKVEVKELSRKYEVEIKNLDQVEKVTGDKKWEVLCAVVGAGIGSVMEHFANDLWQRALPDLTDSELEKVGATADAGTDFGYELFEDWISCRKSETEVRGSGQSSEGSLSADVVRMRLKRQEEQKDTQEQS